MISACAGPQLEPADLESIRKRPAEQHGAPLVQPTPTDARISQFSRLPIQSGVPQQKEPGLGELPLPQARGSGTINTPAPSILICVCVSLLFRYWMRMEKT